MINIQFFFITFIAMNVIDYSLQSSYEFLNLTSTFTETFCHFSVSVAIYRRNILKIDNAAYLNNCLHNHKSDPLCPVFKLGKIVKDAGYDFNQIAYEVLNRFCCINLHVSCIGNCIYYAFEITFLMHLKSHTLYVENFMSCA